jgi:hypothetical protein
MTKIIDINGSLFPAEEIAFVSSVSIEFSGDTLYSVRERTEKNEKIYFRFCVKLKNGHSIQWYSPMASSEHPEPASTYEQLAERERQKIIDSAWPNAETLTICRDGMVEVQP